MINNLERQFEQAMYSVYQSTRKACICSGIDFLQMLQQQGGLKTARRLLATPDSSYQFDAFWEHGRLDLTVEAQVVKPEFAELFTYEERETARDRLAPFGFDA